MPYKMIATAGPVLRNMIDSKTRTEILHLFPDVRQFLKKVRPGLCAKLGLGCTAQLYKILRPQNSYFVYKNEKQSEFHARYPDQPQKTIIALISAAWHALSDDDKADYEAEALRQKTLHKEAFDGIYAFHRNPRRNPSKKTIQKVPSTHAAKLRPPKVAPQPPTVNPHAPTVLVSPNLSDDDMSSNPSSLSDVPELTFDNAKPITPLPDPILPANLPVHILDGIPLQDSFLTNDETSEYFGLGDQLWA